jgi:hypothetical protein
MKLIATWLRDQDISEEDPHSIRWEDGSVATLADYVRHSTDTHMWLGDCNDAQEMHMLPEVVAEVTYDRLAGHWCIGGPGVCPNTLDLSDPNAKDEEIIAELYTFPIVYRARICR